MSTFTQVSIADGLAMISEGDGLLLLDVRTPGETAGGIIPGAILMPMQDVPKGFNKLPKGPMMVYCHVGARSAAVCEFLANQGRTELYNLDGGISEWAGEIVAP